MVRAEVGTHFSTWLREAALALGDEVLLPVTTNHIRAIAATSTEMAVLARSTEGVGVTLLSDVEMAQTTSLHAHPATYASESCSRSE